MNKKKEVQGAMKKDIFARVTAFLFLPAFLFLLFCSVQTVLGHADSVKAAQEAPKDPGATIVTRYDDFIVSTVNGIELPEESREAAGRWYAEQMPPLVSLYGSYIFSSAAIYTLLAFLLLEYFLFARNEDRNFRHGFSVLFVCLAAFAIYAGVLYAALVAKDYPVEWALTRQDLILCAVLSMLAAAIVFAKLIRRSRRPKLTAVLCVPLAVILYYATLICEGIAADEGENFSRVLRILFGAEELLNPVAGIALSLTNPGIPLKELGLYLLKSCAFILLFFLLWRKPLRGRDRKTGKKIVKA